MQIAITTNAVLLRKTSVPMKFAVSLTTNLIIVSHGHTDGNRIEKETVNV